MAETVLSILLAAALSGGCGGPVTPGSSLLRPGVQHVPVNQVVGDTIIANLGGLTVSVRALTVAGLHDYFASKPGLVDPFEDVTQETADFLPFLVQIKNGTGQEVFFDPLQSLLRDKSDLASRPLHADEFYETLGNLPGGAVKLRSLQQAMLTPSVVVRPRGEKEGLLLFPAFNPGSPIFLLELPSFYLGGRGQGLLFEFVAQPTGKKK